MLWDEVVADVSRGYPDITFQSLLVDTAAARLVLDPGALDVIVASNLHGDILSDLTAALTGSLGMAPSANLHLGQEPSIDVRSPCTARRLDIAGRGIANPVGAVLSAAMMLDALGAPHLAERIRHAVESTCAAGVCTLDVGGSATGGEVTDAIIRNLARASV